MRMDITGKVAVVTGAAAGTGRVIALALAGLGARVVVADVDLERAREVAALAGGEAVRHTFTQPGTYRYECSLHGPTMSGTVVVTDVDGNRAPTASPVVEPLSGAAPLVVHATANASDARS